MQMMMMKQGPCFFCGNQSRIESSFSPFGTFYECPICGRYILQYTQTVTTFPISKDKVTSYLFYHNSPFFYHQERRDHICLLGAKAQFDLLPSQDVRYDYTSYETIEEFYPTTIEERVKKIMFFLKKNTPSLGRSIKMPGGALISCLFINRYDENGNRLQKQAIDAQYKLIYKYLSDKKYINNSVSNNMNYITVLPEGMRFVENLEKEEAKKESDEGEEDSEIIYKINIDSHFLLGRMKELINEKNTADSIGKSKELIESCCRTILEERGITWNKDWPLHELTAKTMETLGIRAKNIQGIDDIDKSTKALLSNLANISYNVSEIRNLAGSGHGKPESFTPVENRYAQVSIDASIALVRFLWDAHKNTP